MINKKESVFCRKWTFVSVGEGDFFGGGGGMGDGYIFIWGGGAPIIGK